MNEWKEKIIELGESIEYVPMTDGLGRAEFAVCPTFIRGYIRELHIFPLQQDMNVSYAVRIPEHIKINQLGFSSDPHNPHNMWHGTWCKEHKCLSLRMYVPLNITTMRVAMHFGTQLSLEWW